MDGPGHVCHLNHCTRCGVCVEPPRRFCDVCRNVFDVPRLLAELSEARRRIAELEDAMRREPPRRMNLPMALVWAAVLSVHWWSPAYAASSLSQQQVSSGGGICLVP